MPEPKNLEAIRNWVKDNRPDIYPHFDTYATQNAFVLLMTIGFEAGRKFQNDNPKMPLNNLSLYIQD